MFILILGREKSGKSRYAEKLAVKINCGGLYYIATFIPVGEGETGALRVERHRQNREGVGFETIEKPYALKELEFLPDDTVLLEDASNLLANYMFCDGVCGGVDEAVSDVWRLSNTCGNVVAVSLAGMEESREYNAATNAYIAAHRKMNEALSGFADAVVEVSDGNPIILKGTEYAFL